MKKALIIVLLSYTTSTYAFFCPTNFNQIEMGDSLDKVVAVCGKPTQQVTSKMVTQPKVPEQWEYYLAQNSGMNAIQPQGTLKVTFTFDANGSLLNISMNGVSVGATPICGGNPIRVGDTKDNVKRACGTPGFINQQAAATGSAAPAPAESKVVTLIYNSNPPVSLVFQDNLLIEKK